MKKSKAIELPVLNDVVVPGKYVEKKDDFPSILDENEIEILQKQIDKIVKQRLEISLNKAVDEISNDVKKHLDKVLPDLIKTVSEID
ncbi:hypothetical protein QUF50_06600 [Thiotrichales bacterium HSG1]|nr:hypothetical protein [Thiotrichales bacterium HSG1]